MEQREGDGERERREESIIAAQRQPKFQRLKRLR
jgi:hypothetical protein